MFLHSSSVLALFEGSPGGLAAEQLSLRQWFTVVNRPGHDDDDDDHDNDDDDDGRVPTDNERQTTDDDDASLKSAICSSQPFALYDPLL